ncbi:MAG: hypothetical protein ACM37W_16730 [Actinomycetota bacterium]
MVFKKVTDQVQEKASAATSAAQEKIESIIDEFNELLPLAEELGFKLSRFNIEAGLLPQIQASLVASIDNVKIEAIERLIKQHENNKFLVAVFNAVLMAKKIHQRLGGAYISILKDLIVDIKLGVPPSISCRFEKHSH